uniref:Uncharacterized protein n=1 Tax=Faecalibaculum rodentium TaxID=1702221 RepID=A0A140DX76_9FIRM|nr:hypothetical protein AALO17_21190 [Faecalibaculum rodentium]
MMNGAADPHSRVQNTAVTVRGSGLAGTDSFCGIPGPVDAGG